MSSQLLTVLTTYVLIILAELGDKTQVAVLLITSNNPHKRWTVFIASAIALTLCVCVEVTVGVTLGRYIAPQLINKLAGFVFLGIGLLTLIQNLGASAKKTPVKDSIKTEQMLEHSN